MQYKQLELQEIEQELSYVNKELCAALTSEWLTLDEAKELAKKILISKKTVRESVAELLSAIYNLTVETSELGHIDTPNSITLLKNALDNRSLAEFKILKSMMAMLREQATEIRANSRMLRNQACQIRTESRKLQAESNELGVNFIGLRASYLSRQTNFSHSQFLSNSSKLTLQ
ncbi:hypothetical protein QUB80_09515 [Chlorogloeopsis sp. ULAP01]|uniref:hypothetical protein n=1 Tax=Chlorogloeopsis sp. ULAP01 TaxID=3056483 RepID=UPI0025AB2AF3|nr:hypothetical protein [Chlorogloeopsis sp. ULAP01]MDM9380941.1 hypothetical protein [Chlorogloeopsis sp. ULAP01]